MNLDIIIFKRKSSCEIDVGEMFAKYTYIVHSTMSIREITKEKKSHIQGEKSIICSQRF